MIVNRNEDSNSLVKFVSYDGRYPNLCSGELILNVNGKYYTWKSCCGFLHSGGGIQGDYEGTYSGEWGIDYGQIPDEIKEFADEIDVCVNDNIPWGCCGGCI